MTRTTKCRLIWAAIILGLLALLNPGYSSVYVDGPNGAIRTQRFSFGPGSLIVFTRVVADETSVKIEQR